MRDTLRLISLLGFFIFVISNLNAQSNVTNNGLLHLTSSLDTIYISGSLLNNGTADLRNNGNLFIKNDLTNAQPVFSRGNGKLFMKGTVAQSINGVAPFFTYDFLSENSSIVSLQNQFNVINDLIVNSGTFSIDTHKINIGGVIQSTGQFVVKNGTVNLNGSTPQTVSATAFSGKLVGNLMISNDVSMLGNDSILKSLSFGSSDKTFITGNELVLRSTDTGTAVISDITNGGSYSGNRISGTLYIERYIPARKAWRLLSAPVQSGTAPLIHNAWQEGSATSNLTPGYGVHITGGTVANGFDQSSTNNSSVKYHDNSTNSLKGLPAVPGTKIPITSYSGYFVYIRGNRSIDLSQGVNAAITATTLRMKGSVNTNNHISNVHGTGHTLFGNPYASPIDFQKLTRSNVKNAFYVWDPQLTGSYGLGSYVTFIWNNGTGTYDATTAASPVSQYIPSGEAIFVESLDGVNPGIITVKETDKTILGSDEVFGRTNGLDQKVRVDLYSAIPGREHALMDGVLITYDNDNLNIIDHDDAKKMHGSNEGIGLKRSDNILAIERRKSITNSDTVFLNLFRMRAQQYKMIINSNNMDASGLSGLVKDNYSPATNNLILNMNGVTEVPFIINSDPASYAPDRFSIVFANSVVLPVTFTSIKAYRVHKEVTVEWSTENELNIQQYNFERSADGHHFETIDSTIAVAQNGGSASYKIIDRVPFTADNFYRIRSVSSFEKSDYTNIVKVPALTKNESIHVFPNPIEGNTISIKIKNAGIYRLILSNATGQVISKMNRSSSGNENLIMEIPNGFPAGVYNLEISGQQSSLNTQVIKK